MMRIPSDPAQAELEAPRARRGAPTRPWWDARSPAAAWLLGLALALLLALVGCASRPDGSPAREASADGAASSAATQDDADTGSPKGLQKGLQKGLPPGTDIATRQAVFKVTPFDALPGWRQDNFSEAWAAFRESCKALERKPNWQQLCSQIKAIKDPKAGRQLLEREFTLLAVQNTDRTREGQITGYYEPLLQGRVQRDAQFSIPVYGVPNDMYTLDWKTVPAAQRRGVTYVRANGRMLLPAQAGQPDAIAVDLRRFTFDTLDRRLRVRLQGNEGWPYYSRADIARVGSLNAPVLAWVDDPIALYAMQVQGTGRIRMADGSILRLAYADQNGHPFKPMQLAAQGNERVQTRGAKGADMADEIEHFDLANVADAGESASASTAGSADTAGPDAASPDEPLTRGGRKPTSPAAAGDDAEVGATVDALTPPAGARPTKTPRAPVAPIALTGGVVAKSPSPSPSVGPSRPSNAGQLVDNLLTQGRQSRAPSHGAATTTGAARQQRGKALDSDPSYVFFRPAPDQSAQAGPVGALGVPLTAGRSLAVDPRVMPLGYPVFLDANNGDKHLPALQRLMFAQDTGGAIRGAVRADYFWGFGADAGKQARRTKQKGRMWVLVPHAEVQALLATKLVTRGGGRMADVPSDCLVPDEVYCDDAVQDPQPAVSP